MQKYTTEQWFLLFSADQGQHDATTFYICCIWLLWQTDPHHVVNLKWARQFCFRHFTKHQGTKAIMKIFKGHQGNVKKSPRAPRQFWKMLIIKKTMKKINPLSGCQLVTDWHMFPLSVPVWVLLQCMWLKLIIYVTFVFKNNCTLTV